MFTFGGQISEFSGPIQTFRTLFKAVLDGDVDDSVYDAFEKMGYSSIHVAFGPFLSLEPTHKTDFF